MSAPAKSKEPIFSFTFVMAWIINFSQYMIFYLLVTTMALYAVKEFAASNAASGLASSAFVIGATIARMFAGYLVDFLGHRLMMIAGVLVSILACVAYLPIDNLTLLVVVRIIHGVGYAVVSTATMALAQSVIPAARRAEGTGYFALGTTLATAIGPALGLWIVGSWSYKALFFATVGTAILGGLLSAVVVVRGGVEQKRNEGNRTPLTWRSIVHPAVAPIGLFMLIVGCCYAGIITFINAFGEDRGVTSGTGLFFLAYAVVTLIGRFFLGRIQDERGDNIVIYLGLVSFAVALALLGMAQENWQVIAAGALTGLGYGSLMPAAQTIAVRLVPQSEMGTGISTLFLLLDVGVAFGPIVLGYLLTAVGYGPMYELLAVVVLLAAVLYFFIHGRRQQRLL